MPPRPLPRLLHHALWPLCVLGALTLATLIRTRPDRGTITSLALIALALLASTLEALTPRRADWRPGVRAFAVDAFFLAGTYLLWGPATDLVLVPLVQGARALRLVPWSWPRSWPTPTGLLVAMLIGEFFGYWMHRAQHNNAWLWRFHATHHAPDTMSWSKVLVNHPLEQLFLLAPRLVPLAFLGVPREDIGGYMLVYSVVGLLAHANLRLRAGALGCVFTTPRHHLRHHALDPNEGRSNYGCSVIVWDRLFGTFRPGAEDAASTRLGVGDGHRLTLKELLLLPLRAPRT